ncbi:rab-protein geranylgeranyltransferase [Cylindrobasidium torrendii FP15055 ss-10]|uniref:Geranylgeranyl transferase type-2 subunit alpha n=1 Tax=Cylindrobasidium torrendii FP15055 ss-10 TaxID=1314674 RepID=A0A0D7B7E8_9AGAR|nr:rab-protein geranylgeranyltransferase [Cylindrobasidium torrendii FP15055 ss-10]
MHNTKRLKQSAEALEAKRKRDQAKITKFNALCDDILTRKRAADWSKDAFALTTQMLSDNPEFYTIWNYRRNIMLNGLFPSSTPEEINGLLVDDLAMTLRALKVHPKVYWIWNHRRWCLGIIPQTPEGDDPVLWRRACWEQEMAVVEKMLDLDSRNYHAWNYRRFVLAGLPVQRPQAEELEYTMKKIESNISNFSAWHQRAKVLSSLWADGVVDQTKSRTEELELVKNGIYTDPENQSIWLYHRWLLGDGSDRGLVEAEIAGIEELLEEEQNSIWCKESLVHYKLLLIRKHGLDLKEDCRRLLRLLVEQNPSRTSRYQGMLAAMEAESTGA